MNYYLTGDMLRIYGDMPNELIGEVFSYVGDITKKIDEKYELKHIYKVKCNMIHPHHENHLYCGVCNCVIRSIAQHLSTKKHKKSLPNKSNYVTNFEVMVDLLLLKGRYQNFDISKCDVEESMDSIVHHNYTSGIKDLFDLNK